METKIKDVDVKTKGEFTAKQQFYWMLAQVRDYGFDCGRFRITRRRGNRRPNNLLGNGCPFEGIRHAESHRSVEFLPLPSHHYTGNYQRNCGLRDRNEHRTFCFIQKFGRHNSDNFTVAIDRGIVCFGNGNVYFRFGNFDKQSDAD